MYVYEYTYPIPRSEREIILNRFFHSGVSGQGKEFIPSRAPKSPSVDADPNNTTRAEHNTIESRLSIIKLARTRREDGTIPGATCTSPHLSHVVDILIF